jgi:hypothetical protein
MKTKSKHHARHLPTLTAHISFGDVGLGPDGERFIYITINVDGRRRKVLLRYDDFVDGSGHALARLNTLGAHLISPTARSEFLRRLQDLGPQAPSFSVATRVGPFGKAFVLPPRTELMFYALCAEPTPKPRRRKPFLSLWLNDLLAVSSSNAQSIR